MKLTRLYFILTGIIILFLYGCANYAIHLVDEESKPVSAIPIEILDENGKDQILFDESNTEGKFGFSLEEIPGDSFLIAITGEDYFEENEWISTPNKSTEKKFILEKRVTVITGYVLDESTDGIYDCEITTMPSITKKVPPTDKKGKFVIKSDEFNEGVSYQIIARNPPDYIQNTTNYTPNINQRNDLTNPIYLEKVSDKEDKGNLTQWRYRIGDITDTYYAGEKYEGDNTDLWLETVFLGKDPVPEDTKEVTIDIKTENIIKAFRVNEAPIPPGGKNNNFYSIVLQKIPQPGEQLNIGMKLYPQNTILLNSASMNYKIEEEIALPPWVEGPKSGTPQGTFAWKAYEGNNTKGKWMHSSYQYNTSDTLKKQWDTVWLELVKKAKEFQINADDRIVVKTTNEILECWVGDNQIKDIRKISNGEYEFNLNKSTNLNENILVKFKLTNKVVLSSFSNEK